MKTYRVRIKILSPTHIGTGEVYEPTEFFVHSGQKYLGILDFERFVAHFSEKQLKGFSALCRQGTLESLVKLYKLVDALAISFLSQGLSDFVKKKVRLSEGFLTHYNRFKELTGPKLQKEFNRFTIYRTAASPNEHVPILPGSAVKGALRTAVLNKRRRKARGRSWEDYCDERGRCDSKKLESEILEYPRNRFHQDPFRLVKVSDFRPVGEAKTKILYAVNRKKSGGSALGPYQIFEVIEPGAVFEGEITIGEVFSVVPQERRINSPVTFDEIREALQSFYGREMEREHEEVKRIGADFPVFPDDGFLLRIGRHSGAECVTIEGFRHILIRTRGRNTYEDHATTLWLASDFSRPENVSSLVPFGWAVLCEADNGASSRDFKDRDAESTSVKVNASKLSRNPRFKVVVKKRSG